MVSYGVRTVSGRRKTERGCGVDSMIPAREGWKSRVL